MPGIFPILIFLALGLIIIFSIVCIIANYLLGRKLDELMFSTSVIGTAVYLLTLFLVAFSLKPIVHWLYGPHADPSMDVWNWLIFVPAVPGFVCMIAWNIIVFGRRNGVQ
ncbi:hypothetical protein BH10ACI2_BH10ACI2_00560 [soil metagenome]